MKKTIRTKIERSDIVLMDENCEVRGAIVRGVCKYHRQ